MSSPQLAVPCAVPTMRMVGVLTRAKFSLYPLIFSALSVHPEENSEPAVPLLTMLVPPQLRAPILPTNPCSFQCRVMQIFFSCSVAWRGKEKKTEWRRGKIWIKNS